MSTVVAPPSALGLELAEASARGVAEESPSESWASLPCGESVGVALTEEEGWVEGVLTASFVAGAEAHGEGERRSAGR